MIQKCSIHFQFYRCIILSLSLSLIILLSITKIIKRDTVHTFSATIALQEQNQFNEFYIYWTRNSCKGIWTHNSLTPTQTLTRSCTYMNSNWCCEQLSFCLNVLSTWLFGVWIEFSIYFHLKHQHIETIDWIKKFLFYNHACDMDSRCPCITSFSKLCVLLSHFIHRGEQCLLYD